MKKVKTDLGHRIGSRLYRVYMTQGGQRKRYYIYFKNLGVWDTVRVGECIKLKK